MFGLTTWAGDAYRDLPCQTVPRSDIDLWFSKRIADVTRAKELCSRCPVKQDCLDGALNRQEEWGIWGGEIFQDGKVIPNYQPRGRQARAKTDR